MRNPFLEPLRTWRKCRLRKDLRNDPDWQATYLLHSLDKWTRKKSISSSSIFFIREIIHEERGMVKYSLERAGEAKKTTVQH